MSVFLQKSIFFKWMREERICIFLLSIFLALSLNARAQCDPLSVSGVTTTAADCPSSGSAQVNATGTGLNFKLIDGPENFPTATNTSGMFASLTPGNYRVEVTDGCSGRQEATFTIANAYPTYSVSSATLVSGTLCSVSNPTGGQLRGVVSGGKSGYQYDFVKLVSGVPVSSPSYSAPTSATEYLETVTEFGVYRFYALDACGEVRTRDVSVIPSTTVITNVVVSEFFSSTNCGTLMDGLPVARIDVYLKDAIGAAVNWSIMAGGSVEVWKPAADITTASVNCSIATDYLIHTYTTFNTGEYTSFDIPQEDVILILRPPCGTPIKYCLPFTSIQPVDVSRVTLISNTCGVAFENQRYDIYFSVRDVRLPLNVIVKDKDGTVIATRTGVTTTAFYMDDVASHDQLPLTVEVTDNCSAVGIKVLNPPAESTSDPVSGTILGRNYCQAQEGTVQVTLSYITGYLPGIRNASVAITGGPIWATPHIIPISWNPGGGYILEGLVPGYSYTVTWTNTCGESYNYVYTVPEGTIPGTVVYETDITASVDALCGQNSANITILPNSNFSSAHAGYRVFSLVGESGSVYASNASGVFTNVPPGEYKAKWTVNWTTAGIAGCPINIVGDSTMVTVLGDDVAQSIIRKTVLLCEDGTGLPTNDGKAIIEVNGAPPFTYEIIRKAVLDADPATTAWVTSVSGTSSNTFTWNLPLAGDPLNTEYVLRSVDKCENKITTQASLQPLAPPTFESDMMPCVGTMNYTMSVVPYGGDFQYRWVKVSDPGATLSTTSSLTISGAYSSTHDGTYRCYVTLDGCIERYIDRVLNSTVPGFTVSSDEACVGGNLTMTATGGHTYVWEGPNGFTSSSASITLNNLTESQSGLYKVTIVNAEGCSLSSDTLLTVTTCDLPAPELTGGSICEGEDFTLSGTCETSGATLVWYDDAAGTTVLTNTTVSPAMTRLYYAKCTQGALASDIISVEVVVNPTPTIKAATPVCASDGLTYSVSFTIPPGATITSSSGNVSGSTVSGVNAGTTITVTVTNAEGCTNTTTVTQNCTIPCNAPNPTVTGDLEICEGESTTLTASGCTTGYTYLWSTNATAAAITATTAGTYTVKCIQTGRPECESITPGSATVVVNPIPTITAATPVCAPDGQTYSVTFTIPAGATITTTAGTVTGNVVSGIPSGVTATITVTSAEGCTNTTTVMQNCTVPVFDLALRKVLANGGKNPTVTPGSTVTFKIEVWNQGNVDAQNVEVIDYIPNGLTLVADANWTAGTGVATLTTPIATLAAGDSTSVNISFTVNAGFSGSIRNFAEISDADNTEGLEDIDSIPDSNPDNDGTPKDDNISEDHKNNPTEDEDDHDYEDITVTPTPVFDLALRKVLANGAKNPTVTPGSTVTFKIEVWNQGNVDAQNVAVIDYIPKGLTLVADANWTAGTGVATLTNPIATLAAGDSTSVNISFTVNAGFSGSIRNFAEISDADNTEGLEDIDSTPDSNPDNDSTPKDDNISEDHKNNPNEDEDDHDYEDITVTPTPVFDLALRKTMAPGSKTIYKVGDEVTFNITVFNQGNVVATSVDLVDYIPEGLTLKAGSDWTQDGDKARWAGAITNLAAGVQEVVTITFVVNSSATGVIINTAEISGATNPENLEDIDSKPDDDKDNDGPVKNDEIDEDGKNNPDDDEDDHDIEPITICPSGKCLIVKTTRYN